MIHRNIQHLENHFNPYQLADYFTFMLEKHSEYQETLFVAMWKVLMRVLVYTQDFLFLEMFYKIIKLSFHREPIKEFLLQEALQHVRNMFLLEAKNHVQCYNLFKRINNHHKLKKNKIIVRITWELMRGSPYWKFEFE